MSHSWPATSRRVSDSSFCSLVEDQQYYMMDQMTIEATELANSEDSDSISSCDARSDVDLNVHAEQGEDDHEQAIEKTRSLLSRLEDFKQSYNRTHGQVCEFFERARVVQKLGLLDSSQASKLLSLSGDDADDEEDCNSIADCNYADGQKTSGMKRKLRKWRKAMRSALAEICPGLGLETQTDISPGLMKHIVDEVRSLKSQLNFQHDNILQLAQKSEHYLKDSHDKEQFIADLLQNCKGIRFEGAGKMGELPTDNPVNSSGSDENEVSPLPESLDEIQFGRSKELLDTLRLDLASFAETEMESVVMQPVDFNELQRRQGTTDQSEIALDTSHTQIHRLQTTQEGRVVPRSNSSIQDPRRTNCGATTSRNVGNSQSATCQTTFKTSRNTSPSVGLAPTKKRNFFMSLGGTLTMVAIGGFIVNTTQRRFTNGRVSFP